MVTLDQFPNLKQRLDEAEAVHGYVLTHVGALRRTDNKLFSPDNAEPVLEALYWFLSFVAGRRIAFVSPTGLRRLGYALWQQWNINIAFSVRVCRNWFSKPATQQCFSAAEQFYSCWSDSSKRGLQPFALGLYLACNCNHKGIELVLSESQIALEMLSWVALLEENSLVSEEELDKLNAAARLRSLLSWLGVQPSIPASFNNLQQPIQTKMLLTLSWASATLLFIQQNRIALFALNYQMRQFMKHGS